MQYIFAFSLFYRLEVSVVAQPEATVKWYKDEIQITPSERVEVIREKNTYILIITDVRPEDSGDYICEAENVVGRTVCKTTLTVNRKYCLCYVHFR